MSTTLTAGQLTATAARRFTTVTIAELGEARIQSIDEVERSAYEAIAYDEEGKFQISRLRARRRKLLQLCLVDESGTRLFAASDLPKMRMDAGIAGRLFEACVEHCGLDDDRIGIDDAKKNCELTEDSEEPSESPQSSESTTPSLGSDAPPQT